MDDSCENTYPTEQYCGEPGVIRTRFQHGSGFYHEGGVASIAIIREDQSVDDEFTVDYATNGVTASGNEDYQAVKGTIRFSKGQNHRYINIPVFENSGDSDNEFFQVILTNFTTLNKSAAGDITLATHLGVISDSAGQTGDVDMIDDHSCVCHPTPTPQIPDEITIPWVEHAPPVIKHDGTCYYRTEICRCGPPCTITDPDEVYDTCSDCISGVDPLGDEYELCVDIGDEFHMCGTEFKLCVTPTLTGYDVYNKC